MIRQKIVHFTYDGDYAGRGERQGGGGKSLCQRFAEVIEDQDEDFNFGELPISGTYDYGHLLQLGLGDVFGEGDFKILIDRIFSLMEKFAMGKERSLFLEYSEQGGYEVLEFPTRIQLTRWARAVIRGINTFFRNLVPLVSMLGDLRECS